MEMIQRGRCAITGAGGYLGSHLAAHMEREGWKVFRLTGRPQNSANDMLFTLDGGAPKDFFREHQIDALVHCAYDFSLTSKEEIFKTNVTGSVKLFQKAHQEGVRRLIFISTMSAFDACQSLYGKAKLAVEKEVLQLGGSVIRPGLIYGPEPRGMVGALLKVANASPLIPLIGSGSYRLNLTHEDDLAALIASQCNPNTRAPGLPIIAADEESHKFKDILTAFGRAAGRKVHYVPIPWPLIWSGLRLSELFSIKLPFRSDSVISLVHQDPAPDFTTQRETGITFRSFMTYIQNLVSRFHDKVSPEASA